MQIYFNTRNGVWYRFNQREQRWWCIDYDAHPHIPNEARWGPSGEYVTDPEYPPPPSFVPVLVLGQRVTPEDFIDLGL